MPRTRAASLPARMRTALAFLPIRARAKAPTPTAMLEPEPELEPEAQPSQATEMALAEGTRQFERSILQAEIDDLRRQMDALSAQLKEKQLQLLHLANSLPSEPPLPAAETFAEQNHPPLRVQQFPPEVLQRIFYHVIQSDSASRLPLSQVCFYWRTCALGCPPLWADITLPIRASYTEGFVNSVTLAFQRAKASSLHLRMTYELEDSVGASSSSPGPDYRLLDLALSRQHLWATLDLDLRDQVWTAATLDRLADGLDGAHCPRLRTIDWKTGMKTSPRFDLILIRLLAGAGSLERLCLQSNVDLMMPKPLPSLRSLTIQLGRRPPVSQLIPFLQALPGLTELDLPALEHDIQLPAAHTILSTTPSGIELPLLTQLSLDITDSPADAAFMRQLAVRNLRQLTLRSSDGLDLTSCDHIWRVIEEKGWSPEAILLQ